MVEKEVEKMLDVGVIEEPTSLWQRHPVLVLKLDGSFRVCIDFRHLNAVSAFDESPMPY